MPQQEYWPGRCNEERPSPLFSRQQRVFQSVVWSVIWVLVVPVILTLAWLLLVWWHFPLFLSLPVLFLSFAALMVRAVRSGWSPRPPKPAPKDEQRRPETEGDFLPTPQKSTEQTWERLQEDG
jgi:hypothetical protein